MKSPIFEEARKRLLTEKELLESDKLNNSMAEFEKRAREVVLELQEALVTSWIAETGLLPSDSIICSGPLKDGKFGWWVESKQLHPNVRKSP